MKQEIDFVKVNPTQNMTILVKTNHPAEEYIPIASRLMSYDSVYAEQVGFIRRPSKQGADASLYMAGGEFCGNACMAMAAYLAVENRLQPNVEMELSLECSGEERLIECRVKKVNEKYSCQVTMPLPIKVDQKSIPYEGMDLSIGIVSYDSFFHIVMEVDTFSPVWRMRAEGLARLLGILSGTNLIGILMFEPSSNTMAPLIYLPELDSMIWEKGCGSGTASIGAYLCWKNKRTITSPIAQPGGTILVTAVSSKQEITSLVIEGVVGIVAQGKAFIELEGSGQSADSHETSAMLG
ncbi:diaminopimelate epimerase [Paenibacillus kobensis]|uniref:diaminopimelate epimerase n=1 Tax=Paenibacillus kobensis TaxID=59841 RepID=UPI000FDB0FB5|nr:diaminopimelate epimerase [Paenibacillus kobensis]